MIRILLALTTIILVVAGALLFTEHPGSLHLAWNGWQIDTSAGVGLVLLILAVAVLIAAWRVLRLVLGTPRRVLRRRREGQRLRGYRDLTRGLVAIASGDGRDAERHRRSAQAAFRAGGHELPPLAHLLTAQGALLRGDGEAARQAFNTMIEDPETAFLGYRGLIMQAARAGDDAVALQLTEKARRLRPNSSWALQHQLALEARLGEWRRATDTVREAVKRHAIAAETGRRYKQVLLLAHSRHAWGEQRSRDALSYAAQAHALDEGFVPAATHYATLLRDEGKAAKGRRVIEAAWTRSCHPDLATAYDALLTGEPPMLRARHFERLVDLKSDDAGAQLAGAASALSAQLWGEARRHLDRAGAQGAGPWSLRLCQLMAELERHEPRVAGGERLWLERAALAPRDPLWQCRDCQAEAAAWSAICSSCQSFASFDWVVPEGAATARRQALEAVILPPEPGGHVPPAPLPQPTPPPS